MAQVRHYPLEHGVRGRNVAVAFIKPHARPSVRPWAHAVERWWHRTAQRAAVSDAKDEL